MTHLTNKNSFKNQGLAIFAASVASFGSAHGRKKSFKINKMPQMARMTHQKWHGGGLSKQEKEKAGVTEM